MSRLVEKEIEEELSKLSLKDLKELLVDPHPNVPLSIVEKIYTKKWKEYIDQLKKRESSLVWLGKLYRRQIRKKNLMSPEAFEYLKRVYFELWRIELDNLMGQGDKTTLGILLLRRITSPRIDATWSEFDRMPDSIYKEYKERIAKFLEVKDPYDWLKSKSLVRRDERWTLI